MQSGKMQDIRRTFVPLSSTEHKHSETQQIDFTSYSTNFQAHCPISFEPLGKKAKGCLMACLGFSHSGIIFLPVVEFPPPFSLESPILQPV